MNIIIKTQVCHFETNLRFVLDFVMGSSCLRLKKYKKSFSVLFSKKRFHSLKAMFYIC